MSYFVTVSIFPTLAVVAPVRYAAYQHIGVDIGIMADRSAAHRIISAGQSDTLRALFAEIAEIGGAEGPKYSSRTLRWLAQIIACRTYARPIFQLCHLIVAAERAGGRMGWAGLFWGVEEARASAFRGYFSAAGEVEGLDISHSGVTLALADASPVVGYGHMPALAALAEFLVSGLGYGAVADALAPALAEQASAADLSDAANDLSRRLYEFLGPHLESLQSQRKLRRLIEFLSARHGEAFSPEDVGDEDVFDFWCEAADSDGDFRTYRTAFLAMLRFLQLLEDGAALDHFTHMASIGSDREAFEVDPADDGGPGLIMAEADDDPLAALDGEPLCRIKVLNKRERDAIELPARASDGVCRLPLGYLRAETHGIGQNRVIQAARRQASAADMAAILQKAATETYGERIGYLSALDGHLGRVAEAALHVLTTRSARQDSGNSHQPLDFALMGRLKNAFDGLSRQGFGPEALSDPELVAAHEAIGAPVGELRQRLGRVIARVNGGDDLDARFDLDRQRFADVFIRLYGAPET